jgi:hypothetical protein
MLHCPRRRLWIALLLLPAAGPQAAAQRALTMSPVFAGSLDQPRVYAIFRDAEGNLYDGVGPFGSTEYAIAPYLDTGAGAGLIGQSFATSYALPTQAGAVFQDVGVGGLDSFGITAPLTVQIAPFDPAVEPLLTTPTQLDSVFTTTAADRQLAIGPIRSHNDPYGEIISGLSEFNVLGMPYMQGQTMVVDLRALNDAAGTGAKILAELYNLDDILAGAPAPQIATYLYDSPTDSVTTPGTSLGPGIPTNPDLRIRTSYTDFADLTTTTGGTPPSEAANPFVGGSPRATSTSPTDPPPVRLQHAGSATSGSFLFDTGGAASIVSTSRAADLGITYAPGTEPGNPAGNAPVLLQDGNPLVGDEQFTLTLSGVGGQVTIAGFYAEQFILPALEQTTAGETPLDLVFNDTPLLVLDISIDDPDGGVITLDGVLGMNVLMPSADLAGDLTDLSALLANDMIGGNFDILAFDQPTGDILLTYNPSLVPEPTSVAIVAFGIMGLTHRRRRA